MTGGAVVAGGGGGATTVDDGGGTITVEVGRTVGAAEVVVTWLLEQSRPRRFPARAWPSTVLA